MEVADDTLVEEARFMLWGVSYSGAGTSVVLMLSGPDSVGERTRNLLVGVLVYIFFDDRGSRG